MPESLTQSYPHSSKCRIAVVRFSARSRFGGGAPTNFLSRKPYDVAVCLHVTLASTMATHASMDDAAHSLQNLSLVYSVCFFESGLIVPRVSLLEAASDDEAVSAAYAMNRFSMRELWDRHRLVAVIPAER